MTGGRSDAAEAWRPWYGTRRWRRTALAQLQAEPLCRMCLAEGITTAATVCDHIRPHKGDPVLFWGGPFQSLCKRHHDAEKQQQETIGFSTTIGADGWPVDPNHPSNKAS